MAYYDAVPFLPESSVGYLVRRLHQQSALALEPVFAREGVTMTQWSALVSIMLQRATTCIDLARDLAHDKGAMTRLLDQLEARGFVERERSGDDRRFVQIEITDEGRAVAQRCRDRVAGCWNRWLEDLPRDEVDRTITALRHLSRVIASDAAECAA